MQIKATRTTENEKKKKTVKLKTAEKFSVKRERKNINSDSFNSSTAIYKNSSLTKKVILIIIVIRITIALMIIIVMMIRVIMI